MRGMFALAGLALATGCGEAGSVEDRLLPDPAPMLEESAAATGILNAGVMARLGILNEQVKFLFDPLYDDHFGTLEPLEPLDDALVDRIVTGEYPYHNVDAVFVSHAHGDHFSASQFNRLMATQPEIRLVAPAQAIQNMREDEGWDPVFAARITAISLENGEQSEVFEIAGARIEAFRSPHTGWPDRHADVHNITYRVSALVGGGEGEAAYHRVMHFGDADPGTTHYTAHGEFLSSARTSLAIVPYWHFSGGDVGGLIDNTFNAEAAVGMHVPVSEPGWLSQSGWPYFTGEGQEVPISEVP